MWKISQPESDMCHLNDEWAAQSARWSLIKEEVPFRMLELSESNSSILKAFEELQLFP